MDFTFDTRGGSMGGGGGGSVTLVNTSTGLVGGPITTSGTIEFAPIDDMLLLANISGSSAAPIPNSLSDILDYVVDDTQGDILYRNASGWTFLGPGILGQVLTTGGPSANPSWMGGTGGSVTEIDTGTGLTGGPITDSGTISFAEIADARILANISGASAAPVPDSMSAIFDYVFDNTQGDILFRGSNLSGWTFLNPGDVGQVLTCGGPGANPSWTSTGGGSVTEIDTGAGLIGGPITTSGTISFANITNNMMLANISGMGNPASAHSVSDVLDSAFTATQGSILYRSASQWSYLIPGTEGDFLQTGGASANPSWQPGGSVTGGANLGTGTAIFAGVSGTNLQFKTLLGGSGISITNSANNVTITNTGSGGGDFEYVNTFWVAQNGSDSNDGKSPNTPKLTIAGAIAAFATPTTPSLINIVDQGLYTVNVTTVTSQRIGIYGPGARLQSLTSDLACFNAVTGSSVVLDVAIIQNNVAGDVLTLSGGLIQVNALNIFGDVSGGGTFRGYFDAWNGDGTLTGGNFYLLGNVWTGGYTASAGNLQLTANTFAGPCNLSGSASVYASVVSAGSGFAVSNSGTGVVLGTFGNAVSVTQSYGNGINLNDQFLAREIFDATVVTSTFQPLSTQSNKLFIYNSSSNNTCILTTYQNDPTYPIGYKISVVQEAAGNVQFLSGDTIESPNNRLWTEGRGAIVTATVIDTFVDTGPITRYIWSLSGNTAGSAATLGLNAYVSNTTGDDTTGIGSITQPFATIAAGYASLSSVSAPAQVVILDDHVYGEDLIFDNGFVSLIGPQAGLVQASGDTITCSFSGSSIQIVLNTLANFASGNALNITGENSIFLSVNQIQAGTVNQGNDGVLYIQSSSIDASLTCSSTGTINYVTAERTGSDTPGSGIINALYPGIPSSLPFNNVAVYFSQLIGNDSNSGSYSNPKATIGAALTLATTISAENPPIIYGLDNAAYDEQISIGDNVTISAPQATISSSAGDSITFTGNLSTVTFAVIESSAGNPITQTGSGYNVANFQTSNNWGTTGFDNMGTGTLCLNFYQTVTPIVSTSGGIINLSSPTFPGGTAPIGKLTGSAGGVNYGQFNAGYGGSYAINIAASISHTQVASAGQAPLITASSSTASYVLSNIILNRGTSFSGTSSDRNLSITDGTIVWSIIPTATLKSTINAVWGSTAVPFPATFGPGAVSTPGQNVYAVYSGGTTDYVGGNIALNLVYSQVTN